MAKLQELSLQDLRRSPVDGRTDREVLGLPESYTSVRIETISSALSDLKQATSDELARTAENSDVTFEIRYGAAVLLGLLGDIRLDVFDPPMVTVEGGRAKIGLAVEDVDTVVRRYSKFDVKREWIEKEVPAFQVEIQTFRIGKYPVTNLEYLQFLKDTEHPSIPTSWAFGAFPLTLANHPVYSITPEAAEIYADWLSSKTKRQFRLPNEAEWEYAAAGPRRHEFPWGETYRDDCANTFEAGILASTPVGIFPSGASPFGALDMSGNVEEVTADTYQPYPGGKVIKDELWTRTNVYRISRGGSFTRHADLARCKRRHGWFPREIYALGFRLAEDT